MKPRIPKLPVVSLAVVTGCLAIGLSLGPVVAQTQLVNGSVTVRSDGAVYWISNGVRRWVATVNISDDELNGYPEGPPIYVSLAPFGSAGTSASTDSSTSTGTTASKTGSTVASKTGTSKTGSGTSTIASKTGSSSSSSSSSSDPDVAEGDVVINPTSGADRKNPNDPTLAAGSTAVDPTGKAQPTSDTTCPDSHKVKGGFDKKYYDVDRANYLTVEPELCFRTGKDARDNGYTEVKKN